jgi:hypothetical protein
MPAAPILQIQLQREAADCGTTSLSMYLGETYENVLRVVTVLDRGQGKRGLWTRTLQRIARELGHTLKVKRQYDLEGDYGILRLPDHAVILRNGLVIDTNATVWDADEYLSSRKLKPSDCLLLVSE